MVAILRFIFSIIIMATSIYMMSLSINEFNDVKLATSSSVNGRTLFPACVSYYV